jgi:hypothetical protein
MEATSSTEFDRVRAAHPHLGICVYGMEPHRPVTLEVYAEDGTVHSVTRATLGEALAAMFPPAPAPAPIQEDVFT